jgi:integrase
MSDSIRPRDRSGHTCHFARSSSAVLPAAILIFTKFGESPRIAEYERTSDRALSEDELRAYWKALDELPLVQRATLRFNLALAQQRPTQLRRADWPDFGFDQDTLLLRDGKGRGGSRDHLLPLTSFALEQLKPLRQLNGHTPDGEKAPGPSPQTASVAWSWKPCRRLWPRWPRSSRMPRRSSRSISATYGAPPKRCSRS